MNKIISHFQVVILVVVPVIYYGCENDPEEEEKSLELTTAPVKEISQTSVVSGGSIISNGGLEITDKGICWSKHTDPTINDEVISAGSGSETFSVRIDGLQPATIYHIRAYATNSLGTGYADEITFQTLDTTYVVDIDGNGYPTVVIGNQVWMAKNLIVTKFRSGANIPNITDNYQWSDLSNPAYSTYNNEGGNGYGLLYNGITIMTDEVCPEGWHLPTISEWTTLCDTVGGEEVAGGKLKESGILHWSAPNVGATDEFGFTALPGGLRYSDGSFHNRGDIGYWWAAPDSSTDQPAISITYDTENVYFGGSGKNIALSVRCVKD